MITQNLKQTQNNIAEAAKKSGRTSDDILLVAVSKTKPLSALQEAYNAGIRDFGENKVQELCDKYDQLPKDIRWHMIGHLQRNKVKYLIGKVTMIHSVDSLRLAEEISKANASLGRDGRVLVRVSGTEPLLRIMVEGREFDAINDLAVQLGETIKAAIQ